MTASPVVRDGMGGALDAFIVATTLAVALFDMGAGSYIYVEPPRTRWVRCWSARAWSAAPSAS